MGDGLDSHLHRFYHTTSWWCKSAT